MSLGVLIGLRFLFHYVFLDEGPGMIQSLILASILLVMGFQTVTLAFIADLQSVNRKLLERLNSKLYVKSND